MNLQETITELENQAAKYTEAANNLRALLDQETSSPVVAAAKSATKSAAKSAPAKTAGKASTKGRKKAGKKATVSPETRAKISEALRASHAARKAQPE